MAEFQGWAREAIDDCRARGVVPVLAGGSALYLRAVLDDFEFPGTDAGVRERLEAELAELGATALHDAARRGRPCRRRGDPAEQRPPDRSGPGGRRDHRSALPREPPRSRLRVRRRRPDRVRRATRRAGRADRGCASTGCGRRAWSTRYAGWSPLGLRDGRTASRALGYAQVLRYLAGDVHRGRGARGHRARDPEVRPPPGHLVQARPADPLAAVRRRRTCSTAPSPRLTLEA